MNSSDNSSEKFESFCLLWGLLGAQGYPQFGVWGLLFVAFGEMPKDEARSDPWQPLPPENAIPFFLFQYQPHQGAY